MPVIAFRRGSVPEIMEDGVTDFVVANQAEAIQAAMRVEQIDRKGCRDAFERRFTAKAVAENYLHVYQKLVTC
jgi:glycosyltransferase involved in cell wall biosynthesis